MIYDKDLIMYTKFKHPGAVSSGDATVAVTAGSLADGATRTFKVSIPKENTQFSSAQVYVQDPADSTSWYRTPDTGFYPPDSIPAAVLGVITPTSLDISVIYRNTFGGSISIQAKSIKFKYFLFE